jgi:hypothetical protein
VQLPKWPLRGWEPRAWEDLFRLPLPGPSGDRTLLSELVSRYHEAEAEAVGAVAASGAPPKSFATGVVLESSNPDVDPLEVHIFGRWKFYRARLEAYAVRGSYEFTRGDFKGEVSTPWIDRLGADPGPGWEQIERPPDTPHNAAFFILYKGNAEQALMAAQGPQSLTPET